MQYSPRINRTLQTTSQTSQQQSHHTPSLFQESPHELEFSPLLNKKIHDLKKNALPHQSSSDDIQFLNSNSIVKRYQLLLITCLIMSSIASVKYSTEGHRDHIKSIRDYFNCNLLGNCNRAIYEYGDNIGESTLELEIFTDIKKHFENFVEVFDNFTYEDSFTYFSPNTQKNIILSYSFLNESNFKQEMSLQELEWFLFNMDQRDFLLELKDMEINVNMGKNERINDLNISATYDLSSKMLLNVEVDYFYTPNDDYIKIQDDNAIRIVEQFLAFFLLCSYLNNAYKIKLENNLLVKLSRWNQDIKTLQKNRAYWCYSLAFLNIITMLTETYAPLSSFLQLLPVFERHDSANVYKYNFNTNLRYALPIVMRIFIPVIIMLNGFVFYSMLMYPGEYFEDYSMALFSYVYQNFQVGTYQIFIELQSRGNFAYALYAILYFYMVLVGSNLIPALFCTMIWIKIYQNDLKDYIAKTVKTAICPKCNHCNIHYQNQTQPKLFQLNINSPKISAYLTGKLSTVGKDKSQLESKKKITQMYVEPQTVQHDDKKELMKAKINTIKILTDKLSNTVKSSTIKEQLTLFGQKVEKLIQHLEESIFLTPLQSPKKL